MQIFLYEFITGGGSWEVCPQAAMELTLLAEGRAMIRALAADFCALADCEVWTTRDVRLAPFHPPECSVSLVGSAALERATFADLAARADWTLIIAPETNGTLLRRCEWVVAAGGRLLSPLPKLVALASDKQATAEALAARGVATPQGALQAIGETDRFPDNKPRVIKPVDGCGSQDIRLVEKESDWPSPTSTGTMRIEEFIPGQAASVALLCGPAGNFSLPACRQWLSDDGHFQYLGGSLPLPPPLDLRARRLAQSAAAALPAPHGYLGVDLVLGDVEDGSGDRVIEVNPRLTTSYVGLRAIAQSNLAAAMLAVARGEEPDLRFATTPIEFFPDGRVLKAGQSLAVDSGSTNWHS